MASQLDVSRRACEMYIHVSGLDLERRGEIVRGFLIVVELQVGCSTQRERLGALGLQLQGSREIVNGLGKFPKLSKRETTIKEGIGEIRFQADRLVVIVDRVMVPPERGIQIPARVDGYRVIQTQPNSAAIFRNSPIVLTQARICRA